jgi:O-antigen/teichoic acid export membrane protein
MIKFNEFNKNVAKVLSGTFFAQLLPFALAAILARIYSVEDYGDYYSFAAIVSILGAVSSGKYELAILNPKSAKEAIALCQGAILISSQYSCYLVKILLD